MPAPLALKRQRAASSKSEDVCEAVAEVIVDNGIFHLDEPFSYGVPHDLLSTVQVGSHVKVAFRDRLTTGLVVAVEKNPSQKKLSLIRSVIDPHALTPEMIDLCRHLADRYACSVHDLLRFATSGLSLKGGQIYLTASDRNRKRNSASFIEVSDEHISKALVNSLTGFSGRSLVIFDTHRNAEEFKSAILENQRTSGEVTLIDLAGAHERKKLREAILEARRATSMIAIGLRSSIFSSIGSLDRIYIVNDWSEHHWEQKSPYWSTRDVALERRVREGIDLIFLGSAPSLEIAKMIDSGAIEMQSGNNSGRRSRRESQFLPSTFHTTISQGLKRGKVLVSVASRSYVSSLLCQRCRNRALCECGAVLGQESNHSYRCPLCKVILVDADREVDLTNRNSVIVVSTSGVEPYVAEGYAATVLLDGEFLISLPGLRSEEQLWQRWSSTLTLSAPAAPVYFSLYAENAISQSLASSKNALFISRALRNRSEANLPPFSKIIRIKGETPALRNLSDSLQREMPSKVISYPIGKEEILSLKVTDEALPDVMKMLRLVQRYRSTQKKALFTIKLDPYKI
ncbi:MAG: hypothetical protein EB054_04040 [Actinobacteria bacterium]|nr:hypothetical protein [Actinomycetota bacterium]